MKPGLTEYIKFSDGIQEKFGGLFVASYLILCPIPLVKRIATNYNTLLCIVE
jgi:hypothetical protein